MAVDDPWSICFRRRHWRRHRQNTSSRLSHVGTKRWLQAIRPRYASPLRLTNKIPCSTGRREEHGSARTNPQRRAIGRTALIRWLVRLAADHADADRRRVDLSEGSHSPPSIPTSSARIPTDASASGIRFAATKGSATRISTSPASTAQSISRGIFPGVYGRGRGRGRPGCEGNRIPSRAPLSEFGPSANDTLPCKGVRKSDGRPASRFVLWYH